MEKDKKEIIVSYVLALHHTMTRGLKPKIMFDNTWGVLTVDNKKYKMNI